MNTIKGNYADAVIYTDDIEEYAKAQIQLICDNEISRDTDIRVMPDVHPGKEGHFCGDSYGKSASWR